MRTVIVLLTVVAATQAETWQPLPDYVRSCRLIVKARAAGKKGDQLRFEILESWKGKAKFKNDEYLTDDREHGATVKDGQEIVFFFTKGDRHSTSFPIKDGKLLYASTSDDELLRRSYTVAEFKQRIAILAQPMAETADKEFRIQFRSAGPRRIEFELERRFRHWLPTEVLFAEREVIVEATVDGEPLQGLMAHAGYWPGQAPELGINGLPKLGKIDRLRITLDVLLVQESTQYRLEKLAPGKSAELVAPPFRFAVDGAKTEATVSCTIARGKELWAFEKQLGVGALTTRWGIQAVYLADDKFRVLLRQEHAGNHRYAAGSFSLLDPPGAPLQYPLMLSIRIPKKVEKKRLVWEFRDLKLKR